MFRSVSLPTGVKGELYLHSMLGRYEKFAEAACEIKNRKIDEVICLATLDEISLKSPLYENALQSNKHTWGQRMYPIPNFGAPSDRQDFLQLARDLTQKLLSGKKLLIHCGGGVGRTGTLAIGLLISLGMEADKAKEAVASAHSYPETTVQERLLEWLALKLK